MKRAFLVLAAAPLLAACGGNKPAAVQTVTAPATQAAAPQPDPAQFAEAHTLAAKLGCPTATVTPSGAVADGAVEVDCSNGTPAGRIVVFGDPAALDAYLTQARSVINPSGVRGDRWDVEIQFDMNRTEADSIALAQQKVGGTQL